MSVPLQQPRCAPIARIPFALTLVGIVASCELPSPSPCRADAPQVLASVRGAITWEGNGAFVVASIANEGSTDGGVPRATSIDVSKVSAGGDISQRRVPLPASFATPGYEQVKVTALSGGVVLSWITKAKTTSQLHAQYLPNQGAGTAEFALAAAECDGCTIVTQLVSSPKSAALLYSVVEEKRATTYTATFAEDRLVANRVWPTSMSVPAVQDAGSLGGVGGGSASPSMGPQSVQVVDALFGFRTGQLTTLYDADLGYVAGPFPTSASTLVWDAASQTADGTSFSDVTVEVGALANINMRRWLASGAERAQPKRISVGFASAMARNGTRYGTLLYDTAVYLALTDADGEKIGADSIIQPVPNEAPTLGVTSAAPLYPYADGFLRLGYTGTREVYRQEIHCGL